MAQQFVHCLEGLSICKGETKELEGLIQRCILKISSIRKTVRMYKNHVESLREAGDYRKNLKERLVILQLSAILSEKVQCYQDLNKGIQHRSNKDMTQN